MNGVEFCKIVENRLGWVPPAQHLGFRRYNVEAAKVKRKQATNPELYTWKNLLLAVELLAREKQSRSPIAVFSHVTRALDVALAPESDIEQEIQRVVAWELMRGDPAGWAVRFARASGGYRAVLLDEWTQAVK